MDVVNKVESIEHYFGGMRESPKGTIRVDAATPFALHAIAPLISGFKARYESINVVLTFSESIVDLIDRNVDVAVRIGELSDSSLKARKLGESFRKVYASPGYLEKHGMISKASDLARHSCLGFLKPEKLNTWPVLGERGEWVKIKPDVVADNGETLKQLAIQGCGLACVSSFTVEQEVVAGKLRCVLEDCTQLVPIPIYAVFHANTEMNLRVRRFLDYLVDHIHLG